MKVTIENNELVIRLPLQKPTPSKSGKSKIVASTSGFMPSEAKIEGLPVRVSVNAII
jgi:hypothetical protein